MAFTPLWWRSFYHLLADNALLIAAIGLLATLNEPAWMTPLLKLFFVISYVLFAARLVFLLTLCLKAE